MITLVDIAKPWIRGLGIYEPGRPIEEVARELGFEEVNDIIKLASNENALGPSPLAQRAMKKAAGSMHLYPDGGSFYLRQKLAKRLGVDMEQLLVTHGSNEALVFLGHVFLEKGTSIVMADRAFVVYRLVAASFQAEIIDVPMKDFTHDLEALRAAIRADTKIVFISNPNNPTGTMVDGVAIDRFMRQVPDHVVVVLDEAYMELLPEEDQPDSLRYVREGRNVFVLRTFSKTYGLAGLRVGYAVAPREGIELFNRVRQPFNVNAMGQAAALAALDDEAYVARTRRMVQRGLKQLAAGFRKMGLEYVPSVANFMLVRTGRGREVCEALQRRKVIVRPMDPYGLPEHVRITVGTRQQNEMLLRAMAEVLGRSFP